MTIIRGQPVFRTLKRKPRLFCGRCGTRLFIDVLALKLRGLNGYLLPADAFRPSFHMQCQFAVRPVLDQLPHYRSRPARFGASDEQVDW